MPSTHFDDVRLIVHTRRGHYVIDLALLAVRCAFIAVIGALLYSVLVSKADASESPIGMQSLSSIRAAAEKHVRDNSPLGDQKDKASLFVNAAELDARLQMPECGEELNTFTLNAAPIAARTIIAVRCNSKANWTVYVPVNVESDLSVLVLRHALPRDAHVVIADVEVQHRRVPGFGNSYICDVNALAEQHLKRPISSGTVLTTDFLARDLLVKRGQQVLLVVAVDGLAIHAPGLALADGGIADRIRVQNQTSLKVVEGVVENGTVVRVGL